MFKTNPTLRSLAVLVTLLAVCCAGTAILHANLSRPVMASGRMPAAHVVWSIPAADVRSVSFSPSGRYLCTVSKTSQVACYDSTSARRFVTQVPGASKALVTPDGNCVLAYSHMNRANSRLVFLDRNGRIIWQMSVSGAVWSADAGNCEGQACFAVGTGAHYVYLITIDGSAKHYRRWRAPGAVSSVSLDTNCENVSLGTWQQSSVSRSDLAGHRDWELDADSASLHYMQSLSGSDRVFVRSMPNRWDMDGEAWLVDSDGSIAGRLQLSASEKTSALPSPDGSYICTGYIKSIRHSAKSTPEKHAALYDSEGTKLWDKGSLLFPTTPIMVTQGGFVLLAGSKNAVFAVDPAGEMKQICKIPAAVDSAVPSRDGLRALLLCADGKIRFLQVSP